MRNKKLFIAIVLISFTQACGTSQNNAEETTVFNLVDSSAILSSPTVGVLDKGFQSYLSKYYYNTTVPISTQELLKEIYTKIPPPLKKDKTALTDFRLKPLSIEEIERYLGIEETKEVQKRNLDIKNGNLVEGDKLEYYPSYMLNTSKKNVITCLIVRSTLKDEDVGGLLLINYDLEGKIISKKMIDIASEMSSVNGNYYQTAIISKDSINTKRATYFKDSTIRTTESYLFEEGGVLKSINKQEYKKKYGKEDSKWLGLYYEE